MPSVFLPFLELKNESIFTLLKSISVRAYQPYILRYMSRLKTFFLTISVSTLTFGALAQQATHNVGVGTTTPNETAIMDVNNPYDPINNIKPKGLLIPTLNQLQRDLMSNMYADTLPDGLLIYEKDSGNFWFYRHENPQPLIPPYGDWVKLSTAGNSNSSMPTGGIIMWSGTIASIPAGWSLCDGSNGTPDLTDTFMLSVANNTENPALSTQGVSVVNTIIAPDRRFYKIAYIQKL